MLMGCGYWWERRGSTGGASFLSIYRRYIYIYSIAWAYPLRRGRAGPGRVPRGGGRRGRRGVLLLAFGSAQDAQGGRRGRARPGWAVSPAGPSDHIAIRIAQTTLTPEARREARETAQPA